MDWPAGFTRNIFDNYYFQRIPACEMAFHETSIVPERADLGKTNAQRIPPFTVHNVESVSHLTCKCDATAGQGDVGCFSEGRSMNFKNNALLSYSSSLEGNTRKVYLALRRADINQSPD